MILTDEISSETYELYLCESISPRSSEAESSQVRLVVLSSLNPAELTVSSIKKPKAIVVYPRHTPHNAGAKESIESNFVISSLNGYTETLKTQPSRHTRLLPGKKELWKN